jgi:DNA-directed RNA polymerase subunit M/transcription elongation factor TFIIS
MPIDPTGTKPGVVPAQPQQETVNMRCKRNGCDSMRAIIVVIQGIGPMRMYRCAECGHTWGINVGGSVNL